MFESYIFERLLNHRKTRSLYKLAGLQCSGCLKSLLRKQKKGIKGQSASVAFLVLVWWLSCVNQFSSLCSDGSGLCCMLGHTSVLTKDVPENEDQLWSNLQMQLILNSNKSLWLQPTKTSLWKSSSSCLWYYLQEQLRNLYFFASHILHLTV